MFFSLSLPLAPVAFWDNAAWSSASCLSSSFADGTSSNAVPDSNKGLGLEVRLCWLSCKLPDSWTLLAASKAKFRERSKFLGLQERLWPCLDKIAFWLSIDLVPDRPAWCSSMSTFLAFSKFICWLSWWDSGLSSLLIGSKALWSASKPRGSSWLLEILVLPTLLSALSLVALMESMLLIAEHWQECCGLSGTSRSVVNCGWDIVISENVPTVLSRFLD